MELSILEHYTRLLTGLTLVRLLALENVIDFILKFAISNAPKDISHLELAKASTMRWPIEQCFEDGKSYLGMDHYGHRS